MSTDDQKIVVLVYDILSFCEAAKSYTHDLSFETFEQDPLVQDAVCYRLLSIGEACNRIHDIDSRFLRDSVSSSIDWRNIINMRHILAHGYDRLDLSTVWAVLDQHLDPLIEATRGFLKRCGPLQ